MTWSFVTLSLLAPAVLLGAPAAAIQEGGAAVEHKFAAEPVNGMGISSLSDLRGKPVVVEFWGKN